MPEWWLWVYVALAVALAGRFVAGWVTGWRRAAGRDRAELAAARTAQDDALVPPAVPAGVPRPEIMGEHDGWLVLTDADARECSPRARVRVCTHPNPDLESYRLSFVPVGDATVTGSKRATHVTAVTDEYGPAWRIPIDHFVNHRLAVTRSRRAEFL